MHKIMLLNSFQCLRSIFFMNLSMYSGEIAWRIWESWLIILYMPNPLIKKSHTMTNGANMHPIFLVPWCCKVKRHTSIAHAAGVGISEHVKEKNKSASWVRLYKLWTFFYNRILQLYNIFLMLMQTGVMTDKIM